MAVKKHAAKKRCKKALKKRLIVNEVLLVVRQSISSIKIG
jgi:hypothetical protein